MRYGRPVVLVAAASLLAAIPAAAQMTNGSPGEQLLRAIEEKDGATAIPLIDAQGKQIVNYRGFNGNTALTIATRQRMAEWVGHLLNKGADPNMGDARGDTPLIIASRVGFDTGVDYLLMKRAKVDIANRKGETALIVAVQARQPGIITKLLQAGASPDKRDFAAGLSARDYAKRDSRTPELLRLIEGTKPAKQLDFSGPVIK